MLPYKIKKTNTVASAMIVDGFAIKASKYQHKNSLLIMAVHKT